MHFAVKALLFILIEFQHSEKNACKTETDNPDIDVIVNSSREVTFEPLTQEGKSFRTYRNHLIPSYPRETFLFPLNKG